nr:kelch repeat-containing protein [Sinomicrobium weinanense]
MDLDSLVWSSHSTVQLPQQRHHHNLFNDFKNKKILLFGGFGNQRLTNEFNLFDIESNTWETLSFGGDTISPRYFSGGLQLNKNEIVLFGGIGNRSGDQSLGKIYYYDCYKVNLETKTINKSWDLDKRGKDMVSCRNMILSEDAKRFYTLNYPEYMPSSLLQLYAYDLENGTSTVLGDSIPITSERIRTNANLYANTITGEIFCVVQEFELSGANEIKIYAINSPPVSRQMIYNYNAKKAPVFWFILVAIVLMVSGLVFIIFVWRRKRRNNRDICFKQVQRLKTDADKNYTESNGINAVWLFGNFKVNSDKGKDISYLFSPNIKQLFILILIHSVREHSAGVSSEIIYDVLWPDKSVKHAKNLKNVTLNQLRKIISELKGVEIIYEQKNFKLIYEQNFQCDYFEFLEAVKGLDISMPEEENLSQIIKIIKRGRFLKFLENEYFDREKKELELEILKVIPLKIKRSYQSKNYYKTIRYCEVLFYADPLNELAFYHKIHSYWHLNLKEEARKKYNAFIVKYREFLDDDFPYTFSEVIREIPGDLLL